jgi:hypothetical protein
MLPDELFVQQVAGMGAGGDRGADGEMKGGPLTGDAFHPNVAAHHFAQPLLIASPSRVPPYLRVVEASTWLKERNRRSMRSAGIPMPVSWMEKCSKQ